MGVEFRILGPLEALVAGDPVPLGGPRQRTLLALLLAQANETVPAERLIDRVWDEAPPETAPNLVQGYVSQLRRALGKETIATRGGGYAAVLAPGQLDLDRFEGHLDEAEAARTAGDATAAARELGAALGLWRGPALADLSDSLAVRPIAARLDELRLAALERRIEAELESGRLAEASAELETLVAEHPLRERLRALRMLALYRAGRQGEALEAYREARAVLVEGLGIEPGAELQELERAILRQDPSLSAPEERPAAASVEPAAQPRRAVFGTALEHDSLAAIAKLGALLAGNADHELLLALTVARPEELAAANDLIRGVAEPLGGGGALVRSGAFTSLAPGAELAQFAREQDVDLLLVDAPEGLLEDARLLALLEDAPCDVAVLVGDGAIGEGPVLVPFSGFEHDWAAIELGAWIARATGAALRLAGPSRGPGGRDASRMLASASIALQRGLGVQSEPLIVEPDPGALAAAAGAAGVVAVGLSERWRRDGLGRARTALATAPVSTLLVRRGLRPGGLSPRAGETRFTWTVATALG